MTNLIKSVFGAKVHFILAFALIIFFAATVVTATMGFAGLTPTVVSQNHVPRANAPKVLGITSSAPLAYIDTPCNPGATCNVSGAQVNFSGWAVGSGATISSLQVLVDNSPTKAGPVKVSRPDVCAAYVKSPDCLNGNNLVGFQYSLDSTTLSNGNHLLVISATDATGAVVASYVSVNVQNNGGGSTAPALTVTLNPAVSSPVSVSPGMVNQKISSFLISAPNTTAANLTGLTIATLGNASGNFQNLRLMSNGTQIGNIVASLSNNNCTFSFNPLTISAGSSITLDVYVDVSSAVTAANFGVSNQNLVSLNAVTGVWSTTAAAINPITPVAGQTLALQGSTVSPSLSLSLDPSSPPSGNIVAGATNVTVAVYRLGAVGSDITLNTLGVYSNAAYCNFSNLMLVDANTGSQIGQTLAAASVGNGACQALFTNLNYSIFNANVNSLALKLTIPSNALAGSFQFGTYGISALAKGGTVSYNTATGNIMTVVGSISPATPPVTFIDLPCNPGATCSVSGSQVNFYGWAVGSSAKITALQVLVDGGGPAKNGLSAITRISRPDVCAGYPKSPDCANGSNIVGFQYNLDSTALTNGNHSLAISATDANGIAATAAITIKVGN